MRVRRPRKGASVLPCLTILLASVLATVVGCATGGGGGGNTNTNANDNSVECVAVGGTCEVMDDCCAGLDCVDGTCQESAGGEETGTLSGTVTNALTEEAIAGASVGLDPVVAGVSVTTDENGEFSQVLPIGVYTLTISAADFTSVTRTVNVAEGQTTAVTEGLSPVESVVVSASIEGTPAAGNEITVTANVTVLDGESEVESYSWTQGNSVEVTIGNSTSQTATVTLPGLSAYKAELVAVLAEPPISEEQLPPNVELPEGEFPGGLQNRFYVVGLNPFALEEAALVTLELEVETSSGTYATEVEIHAALPWKTTNGLRNVPIDVPVLLQGKAQATYDWVLDAPGGSSATLTDATSQNPDFTPDVQGLYTVTVTDQTVDPAAEVTLEIYAGTWEGAITGEDANGRPVSTTCQACHNGNIASDQFTPWAQTGHAEIFTFEMDHGDHYGPNCFVCHTVGYDLTAENGGFDEAEGYDEFLNAGLLNNPGDNYARILEEWPAVAQLSNIQCENCHGPQNTGGHTTVDARVSLSSDVCAVCHGEPLRHARFQQWQLSAHANYELAAEEGENGSCARCHTAQGFLAWLSVLLDDDLATDPLDDVVVEWTADEAQPITCVVCHDPHSIGTTTGVGTDATVRISGDTPPLIAGFTVYGAGKGAICMTCHNSRRGLKNDNIPIPPSDASRAPHGSSQTDVVMGQNAYLVNVGVPGSHAFVEDTCVGCHVRETPPPDLLSYDQGGTNHTFFAAIDVCVNCHGEIATAESLQASVEAVAADLKGLIENGIEAVMQAQIDLGNTIDLGGEGTVTDLATVASIDFGESHGRQAITVGLTDGTSVGPIGLDSVKVLDAADTDLGELYSFADERLYKAAWNYVLAINDGSMGVHNPTYVFDFLSASITAMEDLLGS